MKDLLNSLFTPSQVASINDLWEDEDCHLLIHKQVGKKLIEEKELILDQPWEQVLNITCLAEFASSDDERVNAASVIYWGKDKIDVLPWVTEYAYGDNYNEKELGYRCLLSLSFFYGTLEHRYQRHSAPSPDFYRNVGRAMFARLNMRGVAVHFDQWEHFFQDTFCC